MNSISLKKLQIFVDLEDPAYNIWEWCNQNFPNNFVTLTLIDAVPTSILRFYFSNEDNKILFILRWK